MKQRHYGGTLSQGIIRNSVVNPLSVERLHVLIWGAGDRQNHFDRILAVNIQQWGYNVSLQPASPSQVTASQSAGAGVGASEGEGVGAGAGMWWGEDIVADVLICDLDAMYRFPALPGAPEVPGQVGSVGVSGDEQLPPVSLARLVIAMSSRSVSRSTLEQLGAVALLYKPFDMSLLQRYLVVMQQLLLDEVPFQAAMGRNMHEQDAQGPARILVVDDHAQMAETIRQCLECEPYYSVRVAQDGLDALEQYISWHPRCIVTDLLMPWMNGYQVIRSLSASRRRSTPAFVVLSALPHDELRFHDAYAREREIIFVEKPFLVEQLLQAVEQALTQ
jgi:CheY-like chemotaxis protein